MSIGKLFGEPPDPRAVHLTKGLREAIVRGDLAAGDRLVERELSAGTGFSRGPVREALRGLEHEGLIVSVPYKGTYVAEVSQREVEDILIPIRLTLERYAIRYGLPDMDEEDFAVLEDLVADMERAALEGDLADLVRDDLLFHERIVGSSGHQCLQIWHTIMPRVRMYFYRDGYRHISLDELPQEHAELLTCMRTKDVGAVIDLLDAHILEAVELDRRANESDRPTDDQGMDRPPSNLN